MGLLDYMDDGEPPKKMTKEEQEEDDAFWESLRDAKQAARLPGEGPPVHRELLRQCALGQVTEESRKTLFRLIVAFKPWEDAYLEELLKADNAGNN